MTTHTAVRQFLVVMVVLAAGCSACKKSPIAPIDPVAIDRVPPPPVPSAPAAIIRTLTITAAPECALGEAPLPAEARVRTYQAAIEDDGLQLKIWTSSPTTQFGLFFGKVMDGGVAFNLAWYDDSGEPEPSIIEQLSTKEFVAVRGHATTTGSLDRLAGRLRGDVWVFATEGAWWRRTSLCTSENHQFVLTR